MLKSLSYFTLNFLLLFFGVWSSVAVYFITLADMQLALITSGLFAVMVVLVFFLVANRNLARVLIVMSYIMVGVLWGNMSPSNHRDWMPSVAKLPYAITQGNLVTVHNIRNFDYQTEFDFVENYYAKTYNLDDLESLSFLLSYWGGGTLFAHTILSFEFNNGDYLAVSAETRLEKGEPQELIQGFFNQYEMIYILADERDIIRLRTNFRRQEPEEVFFYPTTINKNAVRQIFEVIIARVNKLYQQPEFYNTLTHNCFTTLRSDIRSITPSASYFDWRVVANGYADQMLYENGDIATKLSFSKARKKFHINQYVANNTPVDYSKRIRPNLLKSEPNFYE